VISKGISNVGKIPYRHACKRNQRCRSRGRYGKHLTIIPFDEVLRLKLVINREESTPNITVIKQSDMSVNLSEIRPRTSASIELNKAIRLVIHQTTIKHTGSLNNMYTALVTLRGDLIELAEKTLELISEMDYDIIYSLRRFLQSSFVVSENMNTFLSFRECT